MELEFQLLDCDYTLVNNMPIVRLFGKTEDGKTICAFYEKFLPYFYVLPKKGQEMDVIEFLKKIAASNIANIEYVKKFLSIGYQKEKTEILKITLKDPSQTPNIREELKKQKSVQEIFEADILFKYRFMADLDISGMRWIKITGKSASTHTVCTTRTISADRIENVDRTDNVSFKYMGVDIEIVPGTEGVPNATKDPIIIISLSFFPSYEDRNTLVLVAKPNFKSKKDVIAFPNEKKMLEEFLKILNTFDPDVIVGYNINNFDFPYIMDRLGACKLQKYLGRCQVKPATSRKIGSEYRNTVPGRIVADAYSLIKESVDKGLLRLKRYGLGDVSKELLDDTKVDITHSEISKHWNGNQEQVEKLVEYARKDAELALKLLLLLKSVGLEKSKSISSGMLDKFIELSKVSGLLLQDVLDGGEANRVENLLLKEFNKQDFVVPCKPSQDDIFKRMEDREAIGLKGALVLEPETGLHTNCVVYLDFRSMYPSIFIAFNICPTTLCLKDEDVEMIKTPYGSKFVSHKVRQGIIPKTVNSLIEERDIIKNSMKNISDENQKTILNAKQIALKYMTNAFYGYTGYPRAKFYVLDIANTITSCGRELIQKTSQIVETDKQFKVIYGDTDSIMVKTQTTDIDEAFDLGVKLEKKINDEHHGIIMMKIESIFKTLLILSKKRYAGLSLEKSNGVWKEKMVMKGIETVRRDWCDLVSKTLSNILEIVIKEQNPKKALNYMKEIVNKLDKSDVPIDELVITKSISKPLKSYKGIQPHIEVLKKIKARSPGSAPGVGDRIGYVIIKGTQLTSTRAEDPEYVKSHGLKIDSKYYIENQLLPPLERVFDAIGVNKNDIVGIGKQMLLFDAIKNGNKTQKQEPLQTIDGFVCSKCDKPFRRVPLMGKCLSCGGEILFYSGDRRARCAVV